jgi:hypothetical protein
VLSENHHERSQVCVEHVGGDEGAQVRGLSYQLKVGVS